MPLLSNVEKYGELVYSGNKFTHNITFYDGDSGFTYQKLPIFFYGGLLFNTGYDNLYQKFGFRSAQYGYILPGQWWINPQEIKSGFTTAVVYVDQNGDNSYFNTMLDTNSLYKLTKITIRNLNTIYSVPTVGCFNWENNDVSISVDSVISYISPKYSKDTPLRIVEIPTNIILSPNSGVFIIDTDSKDMITQGNVVCSFEVQKVKQKNNC